MSKVTSKGISDSPMVVFIVYLVGSRDTYETNLQAYL